MVAIECLWLFLRRHLCAQRATIKIVIYEDINCPQSKEKSLALALWPVSPRYFSSGKTSKTSVVHRNIEVANRSGDLLVQLLLQAVTKSRLLGATSICVWLSVGMDGLSGKPVAILLALITALLVRPHQCWAEENSPPCLTSNASETAQSSTGSWLACPPGPWDPSCTAVFQLVIHPAPPPYGCTIPDKWQGFPNAHQDMLTCADA